MAELKLRLEPGWLEDGEDSFQGIDLDWVAISRETGLDTKTLRSLHRGGEHKIETALQFEMLGSRLPGMEKKWDREYHGDYRIDLFEDCLENDRAFKAITGTNASGVGEAIFACALSSSAIIREIERAARFSQGARIHDSSETASTEKRLDELFENALRGYRASEGPGAEIADTERHTVDGGFAADFRFTIHDELFPLTGVQTTAIKQLQGAINLRVGGIRRVKDYSDSLGAELEKQGAQEGNKRSMQKTLAQLKRLKMNTLIFREEKVTELVEGDRVTGSGPRFYREVLHIVLAPKQIFRMPFLIENGRLPQRRR